MKTKALIIFSLFAAALLLSACKNNNSTEPSSSTSGGSAYYPNNEGNLYKYSVERQDSTGAKHDGTRSSHYQGTTTIAGVTYQNQIDTVVFSDTAYTQTSLFVKDDSGVKYYMDTTGLYQVIPDSLLPFLQYDASFNFLSFPLQDGKSWQVFNMGLKLGNFPLIKLINVTAYDDGTENISLNLNGSTVSQSAVKVRYVLNLTIPDPNNFLAPPSSSSFSATAWVSENIGVVKWQGNGTVLNAFTGGGIHFADTTSTVNQSLISYNAK
jgi:hypothetical protein